MMFIVVILIVFIINIWMENSSSEFYEKWIHPVLYYEIEFFLILLFGIVIYKAIQQYFKRQKEKVVSLENKINEYELDLKEETKSLWKSYADLNRFNQQETIKRVMKTLAESETSIIAVQLYQYSIKEANKETKIKVTYNDGYVTEGEVLNALLQEHYSIHASIYKSYKRAMTNIGRNNGISLLRFIESNINRIKNKTKEELSGNIDFSIKFALVHLGVQSYIHYFTNGKSYSTYALDILNDHSKEKMLNDNKRTGLLKGILNHELSNGDSYIFFHLGDNNKKGRIYFTKGIKINGKKIMFLITLYNNLEEEELVRKVNEIGNTFEELLMDSGVNMENEK